MWVGNMTDEEIAEQYLFVDLAIKNLELDLKHLKHGSFKIKDPYVELIERVISMAISERRTCKQLMYKKKIQVFLSHRQGDFSTYTFILGGKEQKITFHHMVLKDNVEKVIRRNLNNFILNYRT